MFCKWCGGVLTPSDSKCKRCGKDIPALSDCGGFYDLVPAAKNAVNAPSISNEPSLQPNRQLEQAKEAPPAKKTCAKIPVLTLLSIAVVLVTMFVMSGRIAQYSDKIDELQDKLSEVATALATITAQITSDEQEEQKDFEIFREDTSFSLKILKQQNSESYLAGFDLGDCDNAVSVSYVTGNELNKSVLAVYSVEEMGQVELGFHHEFNPSAQTVSVVYKIDESVFGLSVAPETCEWEYRVGLEDSWHTMSSDIFTQSDVPGETILSISDTELQSLIGDSREPLELRCKICRTSIDGGSVTFLVEGISCRQELTQSLQND